MSFESIWENHRKQLLNFVRVKVNDLDLADDIIQEVGLKLHLSIDKKNEIKNYQTWLFQVARNTIADHYRKVKHLESISDIDEPGQACVCDLSAFVIQKYLPEEYATPLYLSDIEQIPQKEIADILGVSLSATKSRIQRGRKKLQAMVIECVDIVYNKKGQVVDFNLKSHCDLPVELKDEMEKMNLFL